MSKKYVPFQFTPVTFKDLKFKAVQYHRNGVSGDGFYCAVAYDPEQEADMLITYFPDLGQCACAVYRLDMLPNITFGENSWRGDHYAGPMQDAIKSYTKQYDKYLDGLGKD